jgi:uncharacterized coiled-coil DUF342 family protein
MNEAKQLSEVAKALAWEVPYQASLAERAASVMAERDAMKAERNTLRAEIERLRAERDALVLVVMRGSHREARDLARPRVVEMHPEEKGHAAKLASTIQQSPSAGGV